MQELRFVAVSEDGSYAVLAVPGRSARFTLPIDERLRAVALGQSSRLAQYEIEVESPLRPKEIQARIRAGETAEEIADAAGIPLERVRWFEGPVLAERAYIATQAQSASVRYPGDSGPGPRLGDIVPTRISALGADPADAEWDSRKRGDGSWQVSLAFPSAGRLHIAEWVFDARRRHVMPADEAAERLCLPESELPPVAASVPGEATVTPLAPRLGAVAFGAGGGADSGYGPGGGYSTGYASGGGRARQDRPATDRAGLERHHGERAVDRPAAYERPAVYERPAADRQAERRAAERPAGYAAAPPEPYAEPAAYTQAPRPAQPPAHTLSPGHGLVPMWEPPAWDPDDAPEPAQPVRSRPASPANGHPDRVTFEDLDDAHAGPLAFEEPAPVPGEPELTAPPEPAQPAHAPVAAPEPVASVPLPGPVTPELAPAPVPAAPAPQPAAVEPAAQAIVIAEAEEPEAVAAPVVEPAPVAQPAPQPAIQAEPEPEAKVTEAEVQAAEAEAAPKAPEPGQPAAHEQPAPARPKTAKAKGRRSSVPSWDEIMLGSSRQRD